MVLSLPLQLVFLMPPTVCYLCKVIFPRKELSFFPKDASPMGLVLPAVN